MDRIEARCRDYCDGCEDGWEEIHGTYDGPLAEDMEPDEDPDAPGIAEEEREARRIRNYRREGERRRRRRVLRKVGIDPSSVEFICEENCESFSEHVQSTYEESFDANVPALKVRWERFLEERGEKAFPPLVPTV